MRFRTTLAMLLLAAAAVGSAAAEPPRLQIVNDRITGTFREVSVEDVVAAFARESGAQVTGGVQNPRTLTLELDRVPVQVALERVLGAQNFALVYSTDGSVKILRLLGGTNEIAPPVATTDTTMPPAAPVTAAGFLTRPIPVPEGRLRGVLGGGDTAMLQQILEVAVHNEDDRLRAEALKVGISGVESDPELKDAASTGLERLNDETLESLIRGVAGERARELVAQVAANSRVSSVKTRAYRMLRRLVPQAAPGG